MFERSTLTIFSGSIDIPLTRIVDCAYHAVVIDRVIHCRITGLTIMEQV